MRKNYLKNITIYILLAIVAILLIFPILWGLSSSFRSDVEIFKYATPLSWNSFFPVEFTLKGYTDLFTEFGFGQPILNSIKVVILAVVLGMFINSIAAMGYAYFKFKGQTFFFLIMMVSFMVPFDSIALPLYKVVNNFNLVDTISGIVLPGIADGLVLLLFVQFFKGIPKTLLESARVDGANWFVIYMKILFPIAIPIFITAGLMIFINNWNSYLWPLLVARSPEIRLIQVALSDFQQEKMTFWSNLYAATMISAIIPLLLFLPFQKHYVQGITSGSVKG